MDYATGYTELNDRSRTCEEYILRTPPETKLNCDGPSEPVHNNYDLTSQRRSTEHYQNGAESCHCCVLFSPPVKGLEVSLRFFRRSQEKKYRAGFPLRTG